MTLVERILILLERDGHKTIEMMMIGLREYDPSLTISDLKEKVKSLTLLGLIEKHGKGNKALYSFIPPQFVRCTRGVKYNPALSPE